MSSGTSCHQGKKLDVEGKNKVWTRSKASARVFSGTQVGNGSCRTRLKICQPKAVSWSRGTFGSFF